MSMENLKNIRLVDITTYHTIKTELMFLSHALEFKLNHPDSKRKVITDEEVYEKVRLIIDLVEKL